MKKYIKSNIFSFILGAVIFSSFSVYATILIMADQVSYYPKANEWTVTDVESALDDLYEMAKNGDSSASSFAGYKWNFDYTGQYQEFEVPAKGDYKIELWGAQGGSACVNPTKWLGGLGGYTSGTVFLSKGDLLYIYVGEVGSTCTTVQAYTYTKASWNGGGSGAGATDSNDGGGSGGGATDVRIISGDWDNIDSLKSRIMVAGAGAGSAYVNPNQNHRAPSGGGLSGVGTLYGYPNVALTNHSYNATQTNGFQFGKGGNGYSIDIGGGGGGGSGWYGGFSVPSGNGFTTGANNGGSGSSYISGHTGCVGLESISSTEPKQNCTQGSSDRNCSLSPYDYEFTNTVMIDGAGYNWTNSRGSYVGQVQPDGSTAAGHSGNGYARITYMG